MWSSLGSGSIEGAGQATHLTPMPLQEKYGDVSRVCVCDTQRWTQALVWVAAGRLLAETIGVLFSLLERGPWVQKFSNVFCNP